MEMSWPSIFGNEYVQDFAFGLKIALATLDPKAIVIGGEIARYQEMLIPEIENILSSSRSNILNRNNTIIASKLMEKASITGVALSLRNEFIQKFKLSN